MSHTIVTNHPALGGEVTKSPPALPTIPTSLPKPVAQQGLLIRAITAQKSVATVAGVPVKNLTVLSTSSDNSTPSDATTSSGEFVVQGTINLFGNKDLIAELDVWHGPPPPGVNIGSTAPSVQRAVIKGSIKLSQLVPSLSAASAGADLTFENVSIYHQNYLYDPSKGLGYNLDADLIIDSSSGSLSSTLSKVLAVKETTVHIHADFGPQQSWDGPLSVNTLTIEGSFVGHTYAAAPAVQFTSVGVRFVFQRSPTKATTSDVEVYGALNLTPPGGSIMPMELDYTLKDVGGAVQLTASLPSGVNWVNPMGAQGFALNPVTFSSSLPLSAPWQGLTLDVAAEFQYGAFTANFTGSYVPGGTSSLHANMQGFDLSSLEQLYQAVRHEPLKVPKVDVTIESADLSIASGEGFSATLTNVNIAGHGSAKANLSISSAGSVVHAELGTVQFGDLTINSAYIQLDLQPSSSSKSSDATILGDLRFEALEANVAVHLYPSAPDIVPKRTEWTVYAELSSSDNTLALSKIEPRLKGTAFDLALKDVLFLAASQDDPDIGAVISGAYKPKEGIQVFATFDEIPIFSSLAKSNVAGLVLDASWSRSAGFSLNVLLPVARNLTFAKGITTTPVTLSLDLTPSPIDKAKLVPSLQVSAGLYIPVAHSPEPLLFEMILTALETDATIAAELKGNWVDPFGISNEVVIGPDLLLQADLSYATGLSGVLFQGGIAVGNTTASVLVSVDEDPMKEMLHAEIDNLNLTDVVSFAERLLHLKLPPPPSDFLEFDKVKLYICPAGLTVQGVSYPSGFSFESDMILFGKHVNVSCDTSDTTLSIKGAVDDFAVGPLKVNGLDGAKQAVLQVQVGKDIQHLLLDGAVTLYAETYALHLLVDTQPSPEISFKIEFKLTELLVFEVDATLIGALNFKDLTKADFTFNADLEQHLLDYVRDEVLNLFNRAQQAAEEGIDAAKKRVSDEEVSLQGEINQAQTRLNAAQAAWDAHQKSVTQASMKIISDYNTKIQALQNAVASAEKAFDAAVQKAQTDLTNAQHDRQVKMQAAENDLANAQKKAASGIQDAKNKVAAAEAEMNRKFGSAEKSINDAKGKVDDLQGRISSVKKQIDDFEHGPWWKKPAIAGLEAEEKSLEAALKIAQGALDAAQAVLKSADYVADKAGLDAAQKSLDLANATGPALISDSQRALTGVDHLTQAAVDRASEVLRTIQNGSEKIVFDGAQSSLAAFKRASDAAFEAANQAIADLVKSVEYVAFQTATTALAVARSDTKALDAANAVLTGVEKGAVDVLNVGKEIVTAGAEVLNITSIHLSGSLGKSVGGAGLMADVKGVVLKKTFEINIDLNPSKVEDFLKGIFQKLADELKAELHV